MAAINNRDKDRRRRSTDAPPLPAWLRGLVVLGAIGLCACAIFISYAYPY